MHDIVLGGCGITPLASYLKALGCLRIVARQADTSARGVWRDDAFVLRSRLDRSALVQFFEERWEPTPVVSPWNGGSGFYPKDNREALDSIDQSDSPRLGVYRQTISVARELVAKRGWTERPDEADKLWLLGMLRAQLPDAALAWVDAAVVIGEERAFFPPLLGTGGNDGRLDFSNNYMQRVVAAIANESTWLEASLFGAALPVRFKGTMGQYAPTADVLSNPWDFVLAMEGALAFAGAASRRLASTQGASLAFPFHARAAGGHGTLAPTDETNSRDELWLPLWNRASTFREVEALFAEGRAKVGSSHLTVDGRLREEERDAQSALDFARSVARLGIDRGIGSFARYGFQERNGLAYYAVPMGRYFCGDVPAARLLDQCDLWFPRIRRTCLSDRAPASISRAVRRLEDAMFAVARGEPATVALLAMADLEAAFARSLTFVKAAGIPPLPRLSDEWWAAVAETPEARLGISLGSRPLVRHRLLPVDRNQPWKWTHGQAVTFVFRGESLVENLHALLIREDIERQQGLGISTVQSSVSSRLSDLVSFIDGLVDDALIERWARAATLLPPSPRIVDDDAPSELPASLYGLLAIVHSGALADGTTLKRSAGLLARACIGDSTEASRAAILRLSAQGRRFPASLIFEPPFRTRRIAAALAFPLTVRQRGRLERSLLSSISPDEESIA